MEITSRLVATICVVSVLSGASAFRCRAQDDRYSFHPLATVREETVPENFYNLPDPIPSGKPGDLIKAEPYDDYALPYSVSVTRALYHSVNAIGQDVVASGVILVPQGKEPLGGWPVIAWAHPFIGAARNCAPSLMKGLYGGAFLSMYVSMGYAVVATDYVGLGTPFRNAALDSQSNATDVTNAVIAARKAVPQLGLRWVAAGEREGGLAALMIGEREDHIGDSGYLGSMAIAPTLDLKSVIESGHEQPDNLLFLAYGAGTIYPNFDAESIVGPNALARYRDIDKACDLGPKRVKSTPSPLVDNWDQNPFISKFFKRNSLGYRRAPEPILIISPISAVVTSGANPISRMCSLGDTIDLESYDVDTDSLMGESVSFQLTWLKARFSGRTSPSACHR